MTDFEKKCCVYYEDVKETCGNKDTSDTFALPSPLEVIKSYAENYLVKAFVNSGFRHIRKPMLIPVLNRHIDIRLLDKARDEIGLAAVILAHAVQISVFSPVEFDSNIQCGRPDTEPGYAHRFPTPEGQGGTEKAWGHYTMKDLNRSLVCLYNLLSRRPGRTNFLFSRKPGSTLTAFPSYANPGPDATKHPLEGVELAADVAIQAALRQESTKILLGRQSRAEKKKKAKAAPLAPNYQPTPDSTTPEGTKELDTTDLAANLVGLSLSMEKRKFANKRLEENLTDFTALISQEALDLTIAALKNDHFQEDQGLILAKTKTHLTHNSFVAHRVFQAYLKHRPIAFCTHSVSNSLTQRSADKLLENPST